jgi:hypothetical protein
MTASAPREGERDWDQIQQGDKVELLFTVMRNGWGLTRGVTGTAKAEREDGWWLVTIRDYDYMLHTEEIHPVKESEAPDGPGGD